MRDKMPWCAGVVDELRNVFGAEEMNKVIRVGLRADCEPRDRVYFSEAGHVLGRPAGVLGLAVTPVVHADLAAPVPKRGRR